MYGNDFVEIMGKSLEILSPILDLTKYVRYISYLRISPLTGAGYGQWLTRDAVS